MAHTALIVAAAVHLGFQLCVTVLVYPALRQGPHGSFAARHEWHSRRIAPLVVLVYGSLVLACGWSLSAGPDAASVAAGATLLMLLAVTGLGAAPRHRQLGDGWVSAVWTSLLRLDGARLTLGFVLLAVAVWGG